MQIMTSFRVGIRHANSVFQQIFNNLLIQIIANSKIVTRHVTIFDSIDYGKFYFLISNLFSNDKF